MQKVKFIHSLSLVPLSRVLFGMECNDTFMESNGSYWVLLNKEGSRVFYKLNSEIEFKEDQWPYVFIDGLIRLSSGVKE